MIREDFHLHTAFCDGKNTPREMVEAAVALGMTRIGFSGHSYTAFDENYCMSEENTEKYKREISALKTEYRGKIEILCGIEQDIYSTADTSFYDYVIASSHYFNIDGGYYAVDESSELLENTVKAHFGGDFYAAAECYFFALADEIKKMVKNGTRVDIIGHIDLIAKFNSDSRFFDEAHPRYLAAAEKAVDRLLALDIPFEVNTGAISRGWREIPYPAPKIADCILKNGGKLIMSSDAHSKDGLCFGFDRFDYMANFNFKI